MCLYIHYYFDSFKHLRVCLGKCRCSSGQHIVKHHLWDLQLMYVTQTSTYVTEHHQDHVYIKAYKQPGPATQYRRVYTNSNGQSTSMGQKKQYILGTPDQCKEPRSLTEITSTDSHSFKLVSSEQSLPDGEPSKVCNELQGVALQITEMKKMA